MTAHPVDGSRAAEIRRATDQVLLMLDGLIALHLLRLQSSAELARAQSEAATDGGIADIIAESGDHLAASGNFRTADDRRIRARLLNALARGLALGALQPDGVTWSGRHWCVAPHEDCPNDRRAA